MNIDDVSYTKVSSDKLNLLLYDDLLYGKRLFWQMAQFDWSI